MNTDTIPTIRPWAGGPDAAATTLTFGGETLHLYLTRRFLAACVNSSTTVGPIREGDYAFGLPFAISEPGEPVPIHDGALLRVLGYVYQIRIASCGIVLVPA